VLCEKSVALFGAHLPCLSVRLRRKTQSAWRAAAAVPVFFRIFAANLKTDPKAKIMERRIGIRNETKSARECRVPITPYFVEKLMREKDLYFVVQRSNKRVFNDVEYEHCGVEMADSLSHCEVIFGIKEIPLHEIEPNKTYVIFSHTHKGQPYNKPLLRTFMERNCTLIDYECLRDERGHRLVAFGYYAGLAGMINTLWALGERYKRQGIETPFTRLQQAFHYKSLIAARRELRAIGESIAIEGLPDAIAPLTVGIVGRGRVAKGAQEIMNLFPLQKITPAELLTLAQKQEFSNKVIYKTLFNESDIAAPLEEGKDFELKEYYKNGQTYRNIFEKYVPHLSVVVNGIFWEKPLPRLITSDYMEKLFRTERQPKPTVIGDITCDPGGSIEFMHQATDVEHPIFIYNPLTRQPAVGFDGEGIAVMAVDILPSELPRDASNSFSELLEEFVAPIATADYSLPYEQLALPSPIKKAVIVLGGKLTPRYTYLQHSLPNDTAS
jgi:alpha-aminoadipic semialdehyde synthase